MSHLEEFGYCTHKFLAGSKKGKICMNYNCVIHDEYNCNLACYLNLPKYFNYASRKIKKEYFKLVSIIEKCYSFEILELIIAFNYVMNKINENYDSKVREILVVYLFMILDSPEFVKYTNGKSRFKKVLDEKIISFYNLNERTTPQFVKYIYNNFEPNKRFLSRKKNKEYIKKMTRVYILTIVLVNKWFSSTLERLYKPGGKGYIEVKTDFENKAAL
jgi:hypothetical protein